jgi:tetratricopeptide (TPR) repeat protein
MLERNAAQALAYAQDAMTDNTAPTDLARAWAVQGEAHFWLQELGQAIATQTQALLLEPTADRYWWRAVLMDRVNDTGGAIADAEQAIALAPDRLDITLWLGQYALDHDENELALDVAQRASAVAPDDPDVLKLQGDAYYALPDYAAAKAAYERYMTVAPDPAPVVIARLSIIEQRLGG